jgi:hypothetical protein
VNCAAWAASGECDANASYMIGTRNRPGACLWSCRRCELAAKKTPFTYSGQESGAAGRLRPRPPSCICLRLVALLGNRTSL